MSGLNSSRNLSRFDHLQSIPNILVENTNTPRVNNNFPLISEKSQRGPPILLEGDETYNITSRQMLN